MNIVATSKAPRFFAVTAVVLFAILTVWSFTASADADAVGFMLANSSAVSGESSDDGDTITATVMTAELADSGSSSINTIVAAGSYTIALPFVSLAYDIPTLNTTDSKKDGSSYSWTLSWDQSAASAGLEYIIEESNSPSFSSITSYTTTDTSYKITHAGSMNHIYYYRVRINAAGTQNSNTVRVVGAYYNDFSSTLGSWQLVKEDFDDTQNVLSRTEDGNMKMHVQGRWDFMMISALVPAPEPPYRISTRIKFDGPGNLNTYGAVFGADWNGLTCPEYTITSEFALSNCFNNYYRNILLWNWGGNTMQSEISLIRQHTPEKNAGRGDSFFDFSIIEISSPSANDWNEWSWEVYPDGTINVVAGTTVRQTFNNSEYINNPYWGFWASTDEYPGSDPLFDWVLVEPID